MKRPDNWVKLKVTLKDGEVIHKLLCGWSGGYTTGSSWRLSSEPQKVIDHGNYYEFITKSGNQYFCHKEAQTIRMNCAHVLSQLKNHPEVENVEIVEVKDVYN